MQCTIRLPGQSEEEFTARFLYETFHINHHPMARCGLPFWDQLEDAERSFWDMKAAELLEGLRK